VVAQIADIYVPVGEARGVVVDRDAFREEELPAPDPSKPAKQREAHVWSSALALATPQPKARKKAPSVLKASRRALF
jgi:hypothetical protein